jgi:hypothetical protein
MGRSVLAVAAGYLFLAVLSRAASLLLGLALRGSPYVAASVSAGFLAALAGGHACARLARRAEMAHVSVLAFVLAAIGSILVASPPAGVPRSLALAEVAAGVLGVLAGGALRASAGRGRVEP